MKYVEGEINRLYSQLERIYEVKKIENMYVYIISYKYWQLLKVVLCHSSYSSRMYD